MAEPNPNTVQPWYLRNLDQALELDTVTGQVHLRTSITSGSNLVISGNVIVGNVTVSQLGNIDLSQTAMPVRGNVNVAGNVNALVTGNVNAAVTGTVAVSSISGNIAGITALPPITGNVNANITGGNVSVHQGDSPWVVSGTVGVTGNIAGITALPPITGNVNANVSGNVIVTSGNINANVTGGNVNANITGGNVSVHQGDSPWVVSGNVNAVVSSGNITTTVDPAEKTAFQEPLAIGITPVIQADAIYGLDPDVWSTTQLSNGNVVVNNTSSWQVNSGTSTGGYARLATSRYMTYQPGQGAMFRWTAGFTTTGGTDKNAYGIDNIVQTTGPIDREDGYAIGYSGSTASNAARKIGFLHRRAGKAEIRQLTITTAPTGAQLATVTLNGVAYNVSLTASTSTQYTAKQLATGLQAIAAANNTWDIDACGSNVTFTYYSPGAKTGTYSFTSTGTGTIAVGAFSQIQIGATPVDTWTYVDNWDNQNISFDPTKLNVWGLDFRWLGAGIVRLFMEDPATGQMTLMHTQHWTSQNTYPHLNKPSLRLTYRSGTTSGATPSQNVAVYGASVMGAVQGTITQSSSSQSFYNLDGSTRAKDTVWHLLSLQNPFVRANGVNKSSLLIQDLTVSVKSTDPAVIYLIKNCVGTSDLLVFNPLPNATAFNFTQYSVSAVTETLSSDALALVQTIGVGGSAQFNLLDYNLVLAPGETISAFISSTSSFNSSSIGITWKVD